MLALPVTPAHVARPSPPPHPLLGDLAGGTSLGEIPKGEKQTVSLAALIQYLGG